MYKSILIYPVCDVCALDTKGEIFILTTEYGKKSEENS
jgi:hypothetical protein